jgi:hypothetical protein
MVVLVTLVSMLSAAPAEARRRTQRQLFDDKLLEFAEGALQRTSLTPAGAQTDPSQGGVQLSPLGYVDRWDRSAFTIPNRVTNHAVAGLNGHLYILGGLAAPSGQTTQITSDVWRGDIGADGNITAAWVSQPALPAPAQTVPPSLQAPCTGTFSPKAGRSSLAAVSYSAGTTGYLYAIGGSLDSTNSNEILPTSAVAIATVDATGAITGWRPGTCLPQRVESVGATTIEIGGETYIYVVGGLRRRYIGGVLTSQGWRTTYVGRINPSTGEVEKPSQPGTPGWDTTADVPVDGDANAGLWNASLVGHVGLSSAGTSYALYITGGETVVGSPTFNAKVYRGSIDPATKQVTWNTASFAAALPSPRTDLTGVSYDGNVMFIGGRQGLSDNDIFQKLLSNQVDDNMNLTVDGSTASFYESDNNTLPPRYNHATSVATVGADTFVYVVGGQGRVSDNENLATDTLFFGKISKNGAQTGFARNGWFFSKPRRLLVDNSRVLAVSWNAELSRQIGPMDIKLEYRTTSDPTLTESNWSAWTPIADPDAVPQGNSTVNGFNSVQFTQGVDALYFQYRASFNTYQPVPGATWETPVLLDVAIEIEVPGYPNLKIPAARATLLDGQVRGFEADVANTDPKPANEPLQPVSDGRPGTFFVSVYVFKPGQTPVEPGLGVPSEIYAEINKLQFPYGGTSFEKTITISSWCITTEDCATPYNITRQFTEAGTYTIYLYVDNVRDAAGQPYGNVEEADIAATFGETDNLYKVEVNVPSPCPAEGCTPIEPPPGTPTIYLPIIGKA